MRLDVDRLADAVLAGTQALIAKAIAPLRAENDGLKALADSLQVRVLELEGRPIPALVTERAISDEEIIAIKAGWDEISAKAEEAVAKAEAAEAAVAALEPPSLPDVPALVAEAVAAAVDALPKAVDGKDADPVDLDALKAAVLSEVPKMEPLDLSGFATKAEVEEAVAAIPAPRDFGSDIDAVRAEIADVVKSIPEVPAAPDLSGYATKDDIASLPQPKDWAPEIEAVRLSIPVFADPPDLSEFVTKAEVADQFAALPPPVDWSEAIAEVRAAIPEPADVSSFATKADLEALPKAIEPDLSGLATKADVEAVRAAIPIVPEQKDFTPEIADLSARLDAIRMPEVIHGKDGRGIVSGRVNDDGEFILKFTDGDTQNLGRVVGRDGFGFDDFSTEDGEYDFTFVFRRGDDVKRHVFAKPGFHYKGVWRDGEFRKGDTVTWGGSGFFALRDTNEKPGASDAWQLGIKRGADGKDLRSPEDKNGSPFKVGVPSK